MLIYKESKDLLLVEKDEIKKLNQLFFPENLIKGEYLFPKFTDPCFHLFEWQDKALLSHMLIVERYAQLQTSVQAVNIGEVATIPAHQRKGVASELLIYIRKIIENNYAFGFLFCEPKMESFYKRFGWITLDNPNILIGVSPEKALPVNDVTMILITKNLSDENLHCLQSNSVFLSEPA